MKRKLLALITAVVLGIMCTGALAACDKTPTPPPHECGHVCPDCGKCLDATCTDPVCAEKCPGHGTPTPPPDEHVCGHVCPEDGCGKCLDATCTDPVCADKCPGHGTPTPPPPDEHVCGHVCPEDGCGKCLDATCTDPVCADKCAGHGTPTPPPDEHVCGHVCPEDGCGKCLDPDCTDPVCADKCAGHTFTVTFELDGGTGTVSGASHKAGDTFDLPTGDGLAKEACTLTGWNDGTTDYELGAQYQMPDENVVFTAVWEEWTAYDFDAVTDGERNENVTFIRGKNGFYTENADHIGAVACNFGSAIVFDVTADSAGSALLYFSVCDRAGEFVFDDAYSLRVNGSAVASDVDMSCGATVWETFKQRRIAEIALVEGKNEISISIKDTGSRDIAGNIKGITLKAETVECSAYEIPDKIWTEGTTLSALADTGVKTNGYRNQGENCIGNMQDQRAFVAFEAVADADVRAAAYIEVCHRPIKQQLGEAFELYIDGKPIASYSFMPSSGTEWSQYDYVRLDMIEFRAGKPVQIAVLSKGTGDSAYNIRGIKFVTEDAANITPTSDSLFADAATWTATDIAFVTEDGGNKSITQGITVGGGVTIDNGGAWLGNVSANTGASVSFTVTSDSDTQALLSLEACVRGAQAFARAYELTVNGKKVFSCSDMPTDGAEWTEFKNADIAYIDLAAGDNEIKIEFIASKTSDSDSINWLGHNLKGVTLKCESGSVTLKS